MFKGKRIFISGAAGVIGTEMVDLLIEEEAILFVGDLKTCPAKWHGKIKYRQGDLNYLRQDELEEFQPEYFIHLAATFERSAETYDFWYENFRHNVQLSNHLMSLVKDLDSIKSVVYASSYLIYDPKLYNFKTAQESPVSLKETDPIYPRNLTGMAKLSHEIELRFLDGFKKDKFRTSIARIYRGYGRNSRDVISRWVRALLKGEEIQVYRPEGIFDYLYAKDSAQGMLRLAHAQAHGIINLGTGRARRVSDIVEVLKKHFPGMKYTNVDADIPFEASQADTTLFNEITNWLPEYDLEKAIEEIVAFEKDRIHVQVHSYGNVLITSSSQKIPLIKAVRLAANKIDPEIKIYGGDINPESLSFNYTDGKFIMPRTEDSNLDSIINWCSENDVRYIIPTRDGELPFWAKNKETLKKKGISVMISDANSIGICIDKLVFSQQSEELKIPAIPSATEIGELNANAFVVKERMGAGSDSIGINLNKEDAIAHARQLSKPIFQPFISGEEFSADAYITKEGKVKGLITRYRLIVENGESVVTETFRDQKIEELLSEAIEKLNLYGHVILQALIREDGQVDIIECNTRFGGASTLAVSAGLDSFYWFFLESEGYSVENYYFESCKRQIRQVRAKNDTLIYGSYF